MSRRLVFAYPGRLDLNTGGYAYDRKVLAELERAGWQVETVALGDGFPFPDAATLADAERRLSDLAHGTLLLIDGLAFGVLDTWAHREKDRLRIVSLLHHPLGLETGLEASTREQLLASERRALAAVRHVIVTSENTRTEAGRHLGVAPDRITVAIPGNDPALPSIPAEGAPLILSIGTLIPRKGHDVLIAALGRIRDLDWRCRIIGSKALDPETARALAREVEAAGLADRIDLFGECPDIRPHLAEASIFALASRYEGYGMVFAEALVQGLPIVACRAGAVPDVVPVEAGILVPVDDAAAFAAALAGLLSDVDRRRRYAEGAAAAGARLPGWADTARIIASTLEALP